MKILQIGTGRWGTNHLRVLSNLPVDLYVAEISESGREKCLEQGIASDHISDNYRDFLDIVTAVDIVTPASTHFPLCKEFLNKGKNIFVEKPIAETAAEADELATLAAHHQTVFQVGHIFRYDPATDFIREYLQSGQLGAIQSLSGNFSGFKRPRADGGVTISDAIHFIDFFNYLMGGVPNKVLARCEDLLERGMDDMSWIWMDYDGIPAVVEANYFSPEKKRLVFITGEKATLVCDFASSQDKVKIHRNQHILDNDTWKTISGEIIHKEISLAEPLFRELKDFLNCVETRSRPRADSGDGADAMKVVEAAVRSHTEGRAIVLA
jgi:UDP-2-acetamido-3-amino-2,3-dideoxy-glucuronate N-acetyltransferase